MNLPYRISLLLIFLLCGGCERFLIHDSSLHKTEEDFWVLQDPTEPGEEVKANEALYPPSLNSSLTDSSPLPPLFLTPLSLDVTQDMPAEEVLEILCQSAKIPYLLGKELEGHLSYHGENRPFLEILETLCGALDLVYSYDNGLLKIEKDRPFLKTYPITFLDHTRHSDASLTNNTQIMALSSKEGTSANGSHQVLGTKSTQDFWGELDALLKVLFPPPALVVIQKQANLLHIVATKKNHRQFQHLLPLLQAHITGQVLIEAKIVEVTLKETNRSGIDWAQLTGKSGESFKAELSPLFRPSASLLGQGESPGAINIEIQKGSFQSLLHFMESFGTVRTLSSPRLTVLHNQTALLRVAENQVFFDVKYERQFLSGDHEHYGSVVASHSHIQSVPIGLVLSVHPVIQPETQEIILNLRPTLSRVVGTREDPSVQLMAGTLRQGGQSITSEIPIVAIREMDSILKVRSGKTAILGGLMIEGADNLSSGAPGMRRHPLAWATSAKRSNRLMTELVIFIRATIVPEAPPQPTDWRLYQDFTKDPRPLHPMIAAPSRKETSS